jgi:hypothetical protein
MERPVFARPLSGAEDEAMKEGLRSSSDAFVLRRCHVAL